MTDTITVTFGGREVRLAFNPITGTSIGIWEGGPLVVGRLLAPGRWYAACSGFPGDYSGDSPQSAVSALEAKLREHRDQINKVLGE